MAVYLSLFAGAGQQFFTNAGVPLAGGKIYTYGAGGSTPQATYTTSAGNIAHSNPIVLDAAGRVPGGGEIWLTDTLVYKFQLETSTGTIVQTLDNVSASIGSAALVASSGSSLIGFIQAGSGAVARTVQGKLRDTVSVLDFGADPTGVADSTLAIQNAITYAASSNGSKVYLPVGTYKINNPGLTVPTGVWLIGDSATPVGPGTLLVPASASVTRMIAMTGVDAGLENLLLLGEGTKAVIGVDIGHLTVSDPTTPGRLTFKNVVARSCKYGFHSLNGAFLLRWETCVGWDCLKGWYFDNTGAFLARGANIASLQNCQGVSNDEHGLLAINSIAITVDNCGFDSEAEGIRAEDVTGLYVSNTTMDLSSTASFLILGTTFEIRGCVTDQSQLPFTIQSGTGVSKGIIRHCRTTATVGAFSVTPATTQWIDFVENTFDKAIQNDGQRFGHGDRTESNSSTITVSGTPSLITQAITFSRAFSNLRSVVVVPEAGFTRQINTLVSNVTNSGFTVEFQRDNGSTWNNGETQKYYYIAIGAN